MCHPIAVAAAISGTMTAIQGGDFGDIIKSAAIAAGTAYIGGELFGVGLSGQEGTLVGGEGMFSVAKPVGDWAMASSAAAVGSGAHMMMMTPQTPDYSQFGYGAQPYEAFGYSSQHAKVTGSGVRQAAAVLASEIKRAKSLKSRQAEASEDYGLGMSVTGTGLQIA